MSEDDEILASAHDGFVQEAHEMLRQFEAGLLATESNPDDEEALNSAFRAAHTIKGTAGLFGFEAVVSFTHEVESLMEDIRSRSIPLSESCFAALLESRDHMESLLGELGSLNPSEALAERGLQLRSRLRALRGLEESKPSEREADGANPGHRSDEPQEGVWHLSLRILPDALRNGLDPMSFIRYLGKLGQVVHLHTLTEEIPALIDLDPEACYLGFEIRLRSPSDEAKLRGVFEFLQEDCVLDILPPGASTAAFKDLLDRRHPIEDAERRGALLALWESQGVVMSQASKEEGHTRSHPASFDQDGGQASPGDHAPTDRRSGSDRRGNPRVEEARYIRVRADKLDRLIDLIGELVIASSGAQLVAQEEHSDRFTEAALRIQDLVEQARDGALGLRMVPIGETFSRFARIVRDVSKQLGKEVELQITGADTELDKSMVETIADPLMHLVRNSLDHGIEPPEVRLASGKPRLGKLALHAYHESGSIYIEVSDDGKGLNRDRIWAKAVERGLVSPGALLEGEAVDQLIFLPGFSTAEQVTNLSGRGVGMDVVKRNVESLRGSIKIASQAGKGCTFQVRLPLTLAIIDGFLTQVGGVSYVLPLEIVAECLEVPPECTQEPDRICGHFDLRGEVVPYLDLARFYRRPSSRQGRRSVVLVRDGTHRMGLVVDRLLGEHQTVIKPLGPLFQGIQGLAGSTILGSGEVALILDVPALLSLATSQLGTRPPLPVLQPMTGQ